MKNTKNWMKEKQTRIYRTFNQILKRAINLKTEKNRIKIIKLKMTRKTEKSNMTKKRKGTEKVKKTIKEKKLVI